ncbi:MAG: hypothetical protein H6Q00_1219 [Holophagaceae bacterium]|nr:hypothetical protein [Holophagaceae bacterium]
MPPAVLLTGRPGLDADTPPHFQCQPQGLEVREEFGTIKIDTDPCADLPMPNHSGSAHILAKAHQGMPPELLKTKALASGKGMLSVDDGHHLLPGEGVHSQTIGVAVVEKERESAIDLTQQNGIEQVGQGEVPRRHLHGRVAFGEIMEKARQELHLDPTHVPQNQAAFNLVSQALATPHQGFVILHKGFHVPEQAKPKARHLHHPGASQEEGLPHRHLQLGDLVAEGRLGQAHVLGGLGEVQAPRRGQKASQSTEIGQSILFQPMSRRFCPGSRPAIRQCQGVVQTQAPEFPIEEVSCKGESKLLPGPIYQRCPHECLNGGQLVTDARLAQADGMGGPGQLEVFPHGQEASNLPAVHQSPPQPIIGHIKE